MIVCDMSSEQVLVVYTTKLLHWRWGIKCHGYSNPQFHRKSSFRFQGVDSLHKICRAVFWLIRSLRKARKCSFVKLLQSKHVCLNQECCVTAKGHKRGRQGHSQTGRGLYLPETISDCPHFKLDSRRQQVDKSISTYLVELRRIAEHCDFKDTLDEMLRDRLVCGIADTREQHRLLAEHKLTFRKTLDIAQAMELDHY